MEMSWLKSKLNFLSFSNVIVNDDVMYAE